MKEYQLNYYSKFKCIGKDCKHTCCAGWEMNIDSETLDEYISLQSDYKKRLLDGINVKKSKFKVKKEGRCAFLNDEGLCDIIINLGSDHLCQVCRDHPRFRSFFDGIVETGLGFCCEEVARIILSSKEKIEPVLVSDDGKDEDFDFNQKNVLEFRNKTLSVIQDRNQSIKDRVRTLLEICRFDFNSKKLNNVVKTYLKFQRVDKNWTTRLKNIAKKPFIIEIDEKYSLILEQFLVNGIYRHHSDAEDTISVRARTIAVVLSWWLILNIIENEKVNENDEFALIVDVVRAFSVEVEYSNYNLEKLFDFAYTLIKI